MDGQLAQYLRPNSWLFCPTVRLRCDNHYLPFSSHSDTIFSLSHSQFSFHFVAYISQPPKHYAACHSVHVCARRSGYMRFLCTHVRSTRVLRTYVRYTHENETRRGEKLERRNRLNVLEKMSLRKRCVCVCSHCVSGLRYVCGYVRKCAVVNTRCVWENVKAI